MKSQCLPFSQIPHSNQLFVDFLSYSPKVHEFYPRSPRFNEWFEQAAAELQYDAARREQVCAVLARENASWSASPKTLANIDRMKAGAAAVVTGQQVGLFGGPLFSLFKALTAVKLADEATRGGVDCVPVFWLATEDHDLDEINHVALPLADGSLRTLTAPSTGPLNSPVGNIRFTGEIEALEKQLSEMLGDSDIPGILAETYRPGETFGSSFARLFSRLFSEWGVILLDAGNAELHRIAEPIYQQAVSRAVELEDALHARGKSLEAEGYDQQVKINPSSTLLFAMQNGARIPVHRRDNAAGGEIEFAIGDDKLSKNELAHRIAANPQDFSPNVLLRPIVQDFLLPTLAYAGGAAEIAYFAQTAVVYQVLLGKITSIVPRFSATIVDAKRQAILQHFGLKVADVFQSPEQLRQTLASAILPKALNRSFDDAQDHLRKLMSAIRAALETLDKTLVDSANTAESKMLHQLNNLQSKAARAELLHSEIVERKADLLGNNLYPNKTLQEREIASIYFLAHHGTALLHDLYDLIHSDCLDHQIVTL